MGRVGVSITKSTSFRGVSQEFANTYYYQTPLPVVASAAEALLDNLVTKEKTLHSGAVTFVRGRAWSAGGTNAENQMLVQKQLSGVGSNGSGGAATLNMDKERAFLVRFRAGLDSKGRPVYLRKWWHLDAAAISSTSISGPNLANTATLATAIRNGLVTFADDFKSVAGGVQTFELCSENGRTITGDTQAHPYLEHHQLGDMWRG